MVRGRSSEVEIRPTWTASRLDQPAISARLPGLLAEVHATGSLLAACRKVDMSYRHGWDLIQRGEDRFASPLVVKERGRGSTLTPLGQALVWANHRIGAALAPALESLAAEVVASLDEAIDSLPTSLRLYSSHGDTVDLLLGELATRGRLLHYRFVGGVEALEALNDRTCDIAGLDIPNGPARASARAFYSRWLRGSSLQVIDVSTRTQGLIVAPGNPLKLRTIADVARPDVRFINRQRGSATRFLVECMLRLEGINESSVAGWEHGEFTDSAIAAFVASGMADVGVGRERPARQFRLDFVPIATERFVLVCRAEVLGNPLMRTLLLVLRSPEFQTSVDALPGYCSRNSGRVQPLVRALED